MKINILIAILLVFLLGLIVEKIIIVSRRKAPEQTTAAVAAHPSDDSATTGMPYLSRSTIPISSQVLKYAEKHSETYTVRSNDSLWRISSRINSPIELILRFTNHCFSLR